MLRLLFAVLIAIGFAVSSARAVPARPLYEPAPPPKLQTYVLVDLNGTAWLGKYLTINRTYIFEPDGTLSYKSTTPTIFRKRGTWRVEGKILHFEVTTGVNKLMEFRGTIQNADTISGEQISKAGAKMPMTMQRVNLNIK